MLLNRNSSFVALGGIATALSFVCLLVSSFAPSFKLILISMSSVIVGVLICAGGNKLGVVHYIAVSVLAILFLPNKSMAVMYVVALGNYPLLKKHIERIFSIVYRWATKFLLFNLYIVLCCGVAKYLLGFEFLYDDYVHIIMVWLLGFMYFFVYDRSYMTFVYKAYDLINKI